MLPNSSLNPNSNVESLEPIGSVSPKVNTGDELNTLRRELSKPVSLLCPAQAYPTPVYRWEKCLDPVTGKKSTQIHLFLLQIC